MFYLRNFKNFAAAELDLDQSATLLVGPNGSGKSNLIEAVELLSFLAAGHQVWRTFLCPASLPFRVGRPHRGRGP